MLFYLKMKIMKTFTLQHGDEMPALGLGTWKSAQNEVYKAVKAAIKCGYRHIDCAPIYGNEKEIGRAIKECIEEGEITRMIYGSHQSCGMMPMPGRM